MPGKQGFASMGIEQARKIQRMGGRASGNVRSKTKI